MASKSGQQKKTAKQQKPVIFSVDEKVLCYEPDPTKTKVLYDAKVLKVIKTEHRGKRRREYLIHFQGWNSSWDRYVADDLVLKDNEENRTLQLELAEKAEALFQSSNSKSKSKSRGARTIAELVRASLRGIGYEETTENGDAERGNESASEECSSEDSDEDSAVSLLIPNQVKEALDLDYFLINKYEKLTELPAEPNVVQILEEYVKHFGLTQLVAWSEGAKLQVGKADSNLPAASSLCGQAAAKSSSASTFSTGAGISGTGKPPKSSGCDDSHPLAHLYHRLHVVKEVADGCRILIDFLLNRVLLYNCEQVQFDKARDKIPNFNPELTKPAYIVKGKSETEDTDSDKKDRKVANRSRRQKGQVPATMPSNSATAMDKKPVIMVPLKENSGTLNKMILDYKQKLLDWTLVPASMYEEVPSYPSLIYGTNHLLRLFVKLPEILGRMNIPRKKLHVIVHYISEIIDYIMKKKLYGPHLYVPAEVALTRNRSKRRQPQVKVEPHSDEDEQWQPSGTAADIKIKIEKQ